MQTIDVIKSVKQIHDSITATLQIYISAIDLLIGPQKRENRSDAIPLFLSFSNQFSLASTAWRQSDSYSKILIAFGYDSWLNPEFSIKLIEPLMLPQAEGVDKRAYDMMLEFKRFGYFCMTFQNLGDLTTPQEIRQADIPPEIATIHLSHNETIKLPLDVLSAVMCNFNVLYECISRLHRKEGGKLRLIKIESGTTITINLEGVANVVEKVKDFVCQVWDKIRHKDAETILMNNQVIRDTVATIMEVDRLREENVLPPEEIESICRDLSKNIIAFFKGGARIEEIKPQDIIDNQKLLGEYQQRLLPPPPDKPKKKKTAIKKRTVKKKKKKNKTKT